MICDQKAFAIDKSSIDAVMNQPRWVENLVEGLRDGWWEFYVSALEQISLNDLVVEVQSAGPT
jgi:hypothetical protein